MLEERLKADEEAEAQYEEQAAQCEEQRKLWLEHQHRNVERGEGHAEAAHAQAGDEAHNALQA